MRRRSLVFSSTLSALCVMSLACARPVYPGAHWAFKPPEQVGMDATKLDALRTFLGGRGCVVRHGYMVYTWGDQHLQRDIASAAKPWYSFFLLKAVEDGRLASVDEPVVQWEPCLADINASLGHKDRNIRFRDLAYQTSCYGVREAPGTAFDYNDWQMALFFDALFLRVYGATFDNVDATVLHPQLTDILQCEDNPSFMAFGTDHSQGRVRTSVRDFARFGLLFLRRGNWNGVQLISRSAAHLLVSSPLPASLPRTRAETSEMCPGQRSIGGRKIPDDQADHQGSYSWCWWTNGVDRAGHRHWPDAPVDTYGAFGHGSPRALWVIPSLDIVVSYNDAAGTADDEDGVKTNHAMKLLAEAAGLGSID